MKFLLIIVMLLLAGCEQDRKDVPEMTYILRSVQHGSAFSRDYYIVENLKTHEISYGYLQGSKP